MSQFRYREVMASDRLPDWAPIALILIVWPIVLAIVALVLYVTFLS